MSEVDLHRLASKNEPFLRPYRTPSAPLSLVFQHIHYALAA